jgi:hypothetical protein
MILIVSGAEPASGSVRTIDARKLATHEAVSLLERRGILGGGFTGHGEQLLEGEGI